MEFNKYRIAHVISNDTFIPDGGVGGSIRSLTRMFKELDCAVDVITDVEPKDAKRINYQKEIEAMGVRIIRSANPINYSRYSITHAMDWGICSEESANIRESMMTALHSTVYDLIIIHSVNSVPGIYSLDIWKYIPTMVYTHDPNCIYTNTAMFGAGSTAYNHMLYRLPGLLIATHTEQNQKHINLPQVRVVPLPLTEIKLLDPYNGPRSGVLWIGKWEARKDPAAYVKCLAQTQLPARIITSPTSLPKFRQRLQAAGYKGDVRFALEDYPNALKRGYTNSEEKVKFIRQCRVAYLPYQFETCPLAIDEALAQVPVVLSHKAQDWKYNFTGPAVIHTTSYNEAEQVVEHLHREPCPGQPEHIQQHQTWIQQQWKQEIGIRDAQYTSKARIKNHPEIWHSDYVSKLKRNMGKDDIMSLLVIQAQRTRFYTKTDCFYSETGTAPSIKAEHELSIQDLQQWSKGL